MAEATVRTLTSPNGKVVIAAEREGEFYNYPDHFRWYIVVLDYDGEPMEELDIVAINQAAARKLAKQVMLADYEPGGKIGEVILA